MPTKTNTVIATRRSPNPRDPSTWPVVWRVVAPACSTDGDDWVFAEFDDEKEARKSYGQLRRTHYPVRLERVQCGPLPAGATDALARLLRSNAGAGEALGEISGFWTRPEARS